MDSSPQAKEDATSQPGRHRAFLFAALLAGVQLALLVFSFYATMQPWFYDHIPNPYLRMEGFVGRAHGMACDVVIAGDSSAMSNFVPSVIQARTGLKTCNIADLRSIGEFFGTHYEIDDYLAHNPTPKFLITGWAPGNFNLEHPDKNMPSPENWLFGMQYRRGPWLWHAMLQNPKSALAFLTWAETAMLEDTVARLKHPHAPHWKTDERAKRDRAAGMWAVPDPIETKCLGHPDIFPHTTHDQNAASVAAFRRFYQRPGMRVLVYVMPVADCVPELPEYTRITAGLADNNLRTQPIGDFNNQDIHLAPPAAAIFSEEIAGQLNAMLKQGEQPKP